MKRIFLTVLFLAGCSQTKMPEYFTAEVKDSPVYYVEKIDHPRAKVSFPYVVFGFCDMADGFGNYPIYIVNSKKNDSWVLLHEKIHRFEALQEWRQGYTNFIFDLETELSRPYDVEDLPEITKEILKDKDFEKKYIVWKFLNGEYEVDKKPTITVCQPDGNTYTLPAPIVLKKGGTTLKGILNGEYEK